MHLHEVTGWPGPLTHRQALAWDYWLADDMNRPSRTDYYLMSLTATLKQVNNTTKGKRFDANDEQLKFKLKSAPTTPSQQMNEYSKAVGMAVLGAGAVHKTRTRAEAIALGLIPPDEDDVDDRN